MIKYIQPRKINNDLINEYLQYSKDYNWYTNNGPVKRLLENKLHKLMRLPTSKKVLCLSNGTTALHTLVFYYEKLYNKKLKWITPAFTFPSCVVNEMNTHVVDINPETLTIDENDITDDIDGIIITNIFGIPVKFNYEKFKNKIIIVDNASSFMTISDETNINLLGNASFSSLHHTKTLGFGEGGFVVVDSDMYDDLQAISVFGFRVQDKQFITKSSNFKMSDISAAYILQHIETYDIKRHLQLQELFAHKMSDVKHARILNYDKHIFYGNLPIVFDSDISIDVFKVCGVEVNKYYKPLENLVNSDILYKKIINFPIYATMTEDDIDFMANLIYLYQT